MQDGRRPCHVADLPAHACRCFKEVTCCAVTIRSLGTAVELIDHAISEALLKKKPVHIQARA